MARMEIYESDYHDEDDESHAERKARIQRLTYAREQLTSKLQELERNFVLESGEAFGLTMVLNEAMTAIDELPNEVAVKHYLAKSMEQHRRERDQREKERCKRGGRAE